MFRCRRLPPGTDSDTLASTRPNQVLQHMTEGQGKAAVVSRKRTKQQNKTPQIKFSYTSVSRLHVSHLSIIYRRPQRAVAELVRAGGSKLGSRRRGGSRWSVVVRMLVLTATRRAGGGGSGSSVLVVVVVVEGFRAGPLLPGAGGLSVQGCGRAGPLAATSRSLGTWSQRLFSKFPVDGAFESRQHFPQSPSCMVVVVVVAVRGAGGVSLPPHLGRSGCRASRKLSRVAKTMAKKTLG